MQPPAAPTGPLELRIAPTADELASGIVEQYKKALAEGRMSAEGRYLWIPVRPGINLGPLEVTDAHAGKTWLLVHNQEPFLMVPSQGWCLARVDRTTDANGRRAVHVDFDDAGTERLLQLTKANGGKALAEIVNGVVVSAPMIRAGQSGVSSVIVVGSFTEQEIDGMIASLRKGLVEPPAKATVTVREAADQPQGTPGQGEDALRRLLAGAQPGTVVTVPKGRYTTPVEITKPVTLRGRSPEDCIIEVTADQPALLVKAQGQGQVTIENLTIRWQLAGKAKTELPAALLVRGSDALIRNCRFAPLGDFKRSPMAVYFDRPSLSIVDNCRFSGFDYVVCYGQGTQGTVQDCVIADCGHQGVINYDGATLTVQRNIITGSKFHAVRCTGGNLTVKDNLLIKNANRGIYLGNKTGRGTITNNLIVDNGTGISAFGQAQYAIAYNVISNNSFAGIDMRDSCQLSIHSNVLVKNQRGIKLFKEGAANLNQVQRIMFWGNGVDVEDLRRPSGSVTADPQFADPNHGDFTLHRPAWGGLTDPNVIKKLWQRYEQLQHERSTRADAVSQRPSAQAPTPAAAVNREDATGLAWQRTDRYVPPDPNGFFPNDPEGGKKLDALFRAVDKDQRSDEEILSTVQRGFRRTTQDRALVLRWIGNRYIWNQDPQNARAVEIMYHAVPLERSDAVYFGLSVLRDKPANVLRTLADVCLESSNEVGRITWGLGSQREALLPYLTPYLQDPDGAKRELAGVLVKHFKGELDFDQWRRQKGLEQVKAQFAGQAPQFKQTLLTGDSEARYRALSALVPLMRAAGGPMFLDDSLLPALQVASTDPDPRVRNEVARTVGGRWVWGAPKQDPNAIALMLKLSTDNDREVRYNAVYYGLSVVRDKSEPVVRRLVEIALADHENNLYGRIVWGLRGFPRDTSGTFDKVLAEQLARTKMDVRRAAAIYVLYRDVRENEPPADWDLASVRQRYPDDLFVLPVSAREPFQPQDTDALWSEFIRALPVGITAERLSSWYTNEEHACYARIRGKEQAETIRNAIGSHPRLRAGEVHPLSLAAQLYLEEQQGVAPAGAPNTPSPSSPDSPTRARRSAPPR